jgi:hypothetical protein
MDTIKRLCHDDSAIRRRRFGGVDARGIALQRDKSMVEEG